MKILVIADTHISPKNVEDSVELWYRLGEYCVRTKPDMLIHLGDVGDFNSQAWLIKNRGTYTLTEEMDCVCNCLDALAGPIEVFNLKQRVNHHTLYRPKMILTLGNHDVRNDITAVSEVFESMGWQAVDYLKPVQVDGISFVHCAHKGLSDAVCTTAQELVENWHSDIVVGHGHHKDYFESFSLALQRPIFGMRCPVFMKEASDWAVQTRNKWSLGFTEIDTDSRTFVWRSIECLYEI